MEALSFKKTWTYKISDYSSEESTYRKEDKPETLQFWLKSSSKKTP